MHLKRQALLKMMQSRPYEYLLLHVLPNIRLSTHYTDFEGWQFRRAYDWVMPGDILLSYDGAKLSSILVSRLTGGQFSHAALCIDKGSDYEVAEMIHTGYNEFAFFDFCKEADRVAIVRCWDWDGQYIDEVLIPTCRRFKRTRYDIYFRYGVKALYCAELPVMSDKLKLLAYDDSDLVGLGRRYVSPDDLYHAINGGVIFDSKYVEK